MKDIRRIINKVVKVIIGNKVICFSIITLAFIFLIGGAAFVEKQRENNKQNNKQNNFLANAAATTSDLDLASDSVVDIKDEADENEILVFEKDEDELNEEERLFLEYYNNELENDEEIETESQTQGEEEKEANSKAENQKSNGIPYYIKVNKYHDTVTIYGLDDDGVYSRPIKSMVCSTGEAGTPLGTFNTKNKYTWRPLVGNVWGQYATRITGPILFHSVSYSTNKKDTLSYEAYNKLGSKASLGCVRLATIDAKWIYDNCPIGTRVTIYSDPSSPGPLGKPTAIKLPTNVARGWDPTDPDSRNPWKTKSPSIQGSNSKNNTIEKGNKIDVLQGITALDTAGNDITNLIKVEGLVDSNSLGEYTVVYSVQDAIGKNVSQSMTYKVVDTIAPVLKVDLTENSLIPASIADVKKYVESKVLATDKGNPNPLGVEVSVNSIFNGRWIYEVKISATDGVNAVSKSLSLYDEASLVVERKNDEVSDRTEATNSVNIKLKNNRTGAITDLSRSSCVISLNDIDDKQIEVIVKYNYGESHISAGVTLNIIKQEAELTPEDETDPGDGTDSGEESGLGGDKDPGQGGDAGSENPAPTPTTTPTQDLGLSEG